MPNKRDKSKTAVIFYAPRKVKRAAQEKLTAEGSTLSAYLTGKLGELVSPPPEKKPDEK